MFLSAYFFGWCSITGIVWTVCIFGYFGIYMDLEKGSHSEKDCYIEEDFNYDD